MGSPRPFQISDDFASAVGHGLITGYKINNVIGNNPALAADTRVAINPFIDTYIFPSDSGEAMEAVSLDAGDTTDLFVIGLDTEFKIAFETVTLTGLTPVPLVNTYTRINYADNDGAVPFLGAVNVQASGGGQVFAQVTVFAQQTEQAIFTTPSDKNWQVRQLWGSMIKSTGPEAQVTMDIQYRHIGGVFKTPFQFGLQRSGSSAVPFTNTMPSTIESGTGSTDFVLSGTADAAGAAALGFLSLLLVPKGIIT